MAVFGVGDRVVQPQYGPGTITSVSGRHTVIDFDNHGVRTFITTMVSLETTNEPAPPRPNKSRARKTTRKAPAAKTAAAVKSE
ncbi:MAG: hypothetical protein U0Q12_12540 [Vicinamibacterales bacterium]